MGGCDGGEPAQLSQLLPFSSSSTSTVWNVTRKLTQMPYQIQSKWQPRDCPPLWCQQQSALSSSGTCTNSRTRPCLFTAFVILNSGRKCRFLRGRSSFKAHYSDKQPEQPWPGFHWFSTWARQGCWKQSPGAWQLLHPPAVRCRAAEDGPGPALVAWLLLLRLRSVGKGMFIEKGKGKPRK